MDKNEVYRLNERFVKDFSIKIDPLIASSPYFEERLAQYDKYRAGTTSKYTAFINDIMSKFPCVDNYYEVRNDFIQKVIADQEERQSKYGLTGTNLKDYNVSQDNIPTRDIYNDTHLGETLISIDLKSANFQALRFFNKEIVRDCSSYESYVRNFTDLEHLCQSKYLRSTIFGRTGQKQIFKVEKFITRKVVDIVLGYEDISNVLCFNSDEVIFRKTENLENILREVNELSKEIDIIFDVEEFSLRKIEGIPKGYVKDIHDLKDEKQRIDICCVSSLYFPFIIAALNGEDIKDSYLYFRNLDGFLCKFADYPKVTIK